MMSSPCSLWSTPWWRTSSCSMKASSPARANYKAPCMRNVWHWSRMTGKRKDARTHNMDAKLCGMMIWGRLLHSEPIIEEGDVEVERTHGKGGRSICLFILVYHFSKAVFVSLNRLKRDISMWCSYRVRNRILSWQQQQLICGTNAEENGTSQSQQQLFSRPK